MKYESRTIRKAINEIADKKWFLPHIQRPFVWKYERNNNQIKRFFDSILRGYPIGTMLFWITKDDIQLRRFIEDYKDGMDIKDTYVKSSEYKDKEKTLVLDGQQRLQALYIALKGTYNSEELYFDILSGKEPFIEGKDELIYDFEFMSKDEADNKSNQEEYWVLLKDIALSDATATEIRRNILKEMKSKIVINDKVENIVDDNIAKIKNYFGELELIYYYPIDSTTGKITEYEEVLEIFIRTNSGGTPLEKSDLMFSLIKLEWVEAEENFEDLLNSINKQNAFKFDKDFILKTALVLIEKKAQYKVEKFKGQEGEQNLEAIKDNWERIKKSFDWLKDFMVNAGITDDATLPSYNALIPLIYFAYIHDCKPNSLKVKTNCQTWLYKSLLNGNFSGQADTIIDSCVDIVKAHSKVDYFPYDKLDDNIKSRFNRVVDVNPTIIDSNPHLILNLVYLFNKQVINFQPSLNGNSPEIDHIFPKSKMLRTYKYPSNVVNNVGNYMFLEKSLNIEKKAKLPEEYFPEAIKMMPNFYERNFIPSDSQLYNPHKFNEFVTKRRENIFNTIKEVLIYQN